MWLWRISSAGRGDYNPLLYKVLMIHNYLRPQLKQMKIEMQIELTFYGFIYPLRKELEQEQIWEFVQVDKSSLFSCSQQCRGRIVVLQS